MAKGLPGIFWYKSRKRWVVRIMRKGALIWVGSFKSRSEAIRVKRIAEVKHGSS